MCEQEEYYYEKRIKEYQEVLSESEELVAAYRVVLKDLLLQGIKHGDEK